MATLFVATHIYHRRCHTLHRRHNEQYIQCCRFFDAAIIFAMRHAMLITRAYAAFAIAYVAAADAMLTLMPLFAA